MDAVYRLRNVWESFEEKKLIEDRDALIEFKEEDAERFTDDTMAETQEKCDLLVETFLNPPVIEGAEVPKVDPDAPPAPIPDPFINVKAVAAIKLKFLLDQLTEEEAYRSRYKDLVSRKVLKLQNFVKAIFYFLGYQKNQICVESS